MNVVDEWFHSSLHGALAGDAARRELADVRPARAEAGAAAARRAPVGPAGQPQAALQPGDVRAVAARQTRSVSQQRRARVQHALADRSGSNIDVTTQCHCLRIVRSDCFAKDTLIKGQPAQIECVEIGGQTYSITRGPAHVVSLEDEWYEDVRDPEAVIAALRASSATSRRTSSRSGSGCRISSRGIAYHQEWDEIAVLPIKSYDDWWNNQIKSQSAKPDPQGREGRCRRPGDVLRRRLRARNDRDLQRSADPAGSAASGTTARISRR